MLPKAWKFLAAALAILLLLVAGVELRHGAWLSADPLDQWGLSRDVAVEVRSEGIGAHVFRRDHWGFRGPGQDPAQIAILTVGGNTTLQMPLPEDKTWQAELARQFQENGRPEMVVANAGLDGQGSAGTIRAFEGWFPHVPGLKPRFVLAEVGVGDLAPEQAGRLDFVQPRSFLLRQARNAWHRLRGVALHFAPADFSHKPDLPEGKPSLEPYKDRLRRLAQLIHGMGAVPVFMTQARGDGVPPQLSRLNDATRAVCRDEGLLCLDLAREVTFGDGDFYDHLHNTPQGAEKVGRWLYGKLAGLV